MSKLRKWMMKEEKGSFSGSADAAFKLFGRTIDVRIGGDSRVIEAADSIDAAPCTSQGRFDVVDGVASRPEVADDFGTVDGTKSNEEEVNVENDLPAVVGCDATQQVAEFPLANETLTHNAENIVVVQVESEKELPQEQQQQGSKDQPLRKPDNLVACPRCDSLDTKFCYYNNYNINQPRHFCKSCQRYWTEGGTLRNVLVGAGRRKNKYGGLQPRQGISENSTLTIVRGNYHDSAQQPLTPGSSSSGSSVVISNVKAAQLIRPSVPSQFSPLSVMESPGVKLVSSLCIEGPVKSTVLPAFSVHKGGAESFTAQKAYTSSSVLKVKGADLTPECVNKVRPRCRTDTLENKDDCANSAVDTPEDSTLPGNLNLAQQTEDAGAWTHPAAPLGFFNGAWPYGFNIGWSGMGLMSPAASFCAPPQAPTMGSGTSAGTQVWSGPPGGVWTGMWAASMAQPGIAMSAMPFGWNMQQSGWTIPWRPVTNMAVQASMQGSEDLVRKRDSRESAEESVRDIKIARVEAAEKVAAQ